MKKDRYLFPAIFNVADDGISIAFPDLPDCLPHAHTWKEAQKNAKEAMALHLYGMEEDGEEIPEPSDIQDIKTEKNQAVVLVEVWMPPYREKIRTARAFKKRDDLL
ncbi:type II toxin-antitoxin system HicB family antitoxin [Caenibacillus caldisaponilyticus]|uniref:type II toxin-antitoxin system HicB family antitoxin n=1 Tax=Caenibacillus caldisaponilyticus TaxID=1674942 RepID=UPI00098878EC|nr:type II toxin-antitoxin system HicB family antitoxin [Caenibacillus caldisaponilyticus]